jgi:molecular chaperone GrpE (heat shock protein)
MFLDSQDETDETHHNTEVEALRTQILALDAEIAKLRQDLYTESLRRAADLQNAYKRHVSDLQEAITKSKHKVLLTLIQDVIDPFQLAMQPDLDDEAFRTGITMVYRACMELLQKYDLEAINPPVGTPVDYDLHNISSLHRSSENVSPSTIHRVLQVGYREGGTVLRHASVQIVVSESD